MQELFIIILIVAVVSYFLRLMPIALLRRPVRNPYLVAFIEYLPYSVLTAMVLPGVFSATGDRVSSIAGFSVALVAALFGFSLPVVALAATIGAYTALFLC